MKELEELKTELKKKDKAIKVLTNRLQRNGKENHHLLMKKMEKEYKRKLEKAKGVYLEPNEVKIVTEFGTFNSKDSNVINATEQGLEKLKNHIYKFNNDKERDNTND